MIWKLRLGNIIASSHSIEPIPTDSTNVLRNPDRYRCVLQFCYYQVVLWDRVVCFVLSSDTSCGDFVREARKACWTRWFTFSGMIS